MKRISILIISLLLCGSCFAQNPGYMGNHVILNAEGLISPSWKKMNSMSPVLNENVESLHSRRYLGLNYLVSPNIEVIVWDRGTVGAGYNYYNSMFDGSQRRIFYYSNWTSEDESYDFTGNITAHGFNVFYKQYLGDTHAPLGHYIKVTFDGLFYNYACNEERPQWIQYYDEHPELSTDYVPVGKDGKGSIFGLKAEFGYDYLFFNRLKLSMGFTLGTTFGGYKVLNTNIKDKMEFEYNAQYSLSVENYVRNRILNAYWFGIKLGVGVLAF